MKIMICGKGGCGKSTLTVLLARTLNRKGKRVLVVDGDESNLCLPRFLGCEQPAILMDAMGGRPGTREKLKQSAEQSCDNQFFPETLGVDTLPQNCVAETDGIKLLLVGKIREFGEGCACMIGGVAKAVLSRLQEAEDEFVLIDAEAGLEHFGRQVDRHCDLVLSVIDPSFESIRMGERVREIAQQAGVETFFVLNKTDQELEKTLRDQLDARRIIGVLPKNQELFNQSLTGRPLTENLPELEPLAAFLTSYTKPVSLGLHL